MICSTFIDTINVFSQFQIHYLVTQKMLLERKAAKEAVRNKEQSSLDVWTLRE